MTNHFEEKLLCLADEGYRDFHAKLVPTVPKDRIIGVRIPALRALAKEVMKNEGPASEIESFLSELPHKYYEEDILHAIFICELRDFDAATRYTSAFLPYVDNWAVADIFCPKAFKKAPDRTREYALNLLGASHTYTVRVGVNLLRTELAEGAFDERLAAAVLAADRDEYYISMAVAWYFCDSLIKNYHETCDFLRRSAPLPATARMLVGKIRDTYRLPAEQKSAAIAILTGKTR